MSANKGKDTGPERALKEALKRAGLGGYEPNFRGVPGRPDIAYPGRKLAVFVNGCYWHRCPRCNLSLPKTNTEYWRAKFDRNQERDQCKQQELEQLGWKVITVWECEIRDSLPSVVDRIRGALGSLI